MLHVLGCITQQHDLRLVVLAAILCLFACTTAMTMIARGRAAEEGRMRSLWLLIAGLVAGCGIWGLHFVAMLAYRVGIPVAYDLPHTAVSIIIAATLCAIGFRLAVSPVGAAVGGATTGAAISAMHYMGMAAVRVPAVAHWSTTYVAASLIIGVVLTAAALHIAIRRSDILGYAIGATLFMFAIVGMHFTAMSAVVYVLDPRVAISGAVIEPNVLAIAVAAVVALIMALGLIGALVDHHLAQRSSDEAQRLREHVQALQKTQKELEAASEKLQVALVTADAASQAKSQFLATMSHELRTPLNAIIGFSEMLLMFMPERTATPKQREYLNDILSSGRHLLSLINDILDLSKLDVDRMELTEEDVAIDDLVGTPLRMLDAQAREAGVRLDKNIGGAGFRLFVDRRRIQQILINLLTNAIKFSRPGTTVTVQCFLSGADVALAVTDTGIGMAAGDIPRAFEMFRQVDSRISRSGEGAGLGLPLARRLAELHGGRLILTSERGKGTTATVYLPGSRVVNEEESASSSDTHRLAAAAG